MIWFLIVVLSSGDYIWDKPIGYPTQAQCQEAEAQFQKSPDIFWVSPCRYVSEREWVRILAGCRICLPPPTPALGM